MASDYNWHPGVRGKSVFKVETRNLGWWVILAILISVIIHLILYVVLSGIERRGDAVASGEVVWRNQREQVTIDADKLNEILAEPIMSQEVEVKPEKLSDLDMVDKSLDEFDLMEQMKEETIRMSPIE